MKVFEKQGSEGSERQNTTEVDEKRVTDQESLADPSDILEIGEIEDEIIHRKKGRKKYKRQCFAKSAVTITDSQSHDLGTVIVEENKVREATGSTRERWVTAAEKEYVENFIRMNAFTETTQEELAENWRSEQGASNEMRMEHQRRWSIQMPSRGLWKLRRQRPPARKCTQRKQKQLQ